MVALMLLKLMNCVNLYKSLGLELYVDGEKKSLNNSSFNSYEKYRNDYIDEVNQVLEEQLLREFEDNQFNVSADVRDRNAGGKEYAGGVLDLVNVDDFVPVENFYTRKVVFMGYEQMKDEGLEILGKNMGNQSRHLRNPGDEISFAPLNDKDKAPLLAAILKERIENFNDDKVVLGHVLKYTDSVYDSLGSFYKNISDGAFKFSSLNNCVYSRDAVVDAMLGQQLRLMAVRFDMIEHGSSVEQVNEIPDKVIAKTYSKVINDYNNKVFARNMGPASSTQKKFFKRFDMEGKLTEKPDMSYVEAKALIVDKLKEVGALDKDSAARISGYVDIPVMNYDVLYNVKPDVKEYAEVLKNAKAMLHLLTLTRWLLKRKNIIRLLNLIINSIIKVKMV